MSRTSVWAPPTRSFQGVKTVVVQPSSASAAETHTPLSVSDANKISMGQSACVWFFDRSSIDQRDEEECVTNLQSSLSYTLDAYRPWCGRLLLRPYSRDSDTNQIRNFGRLELVNGADDPGALLVVARRPGTLDELVPTLEQRRLTHACWDAGSLDSEAWHVEQSVANPLALPGTSESTDHVLMVKVTLLDDGGIAVAIKLSHACADAHTLVRFANDWAAVNQAQAQGIPLPSLTPLFDASLIDSSNGDMNSSDTESNLATVLDNLPVRRFDSWISLPSLVPTEFAEDPTIKVPAGDPVPLAEVGAVSPKLHYIIHFNPQQLLKVWLTASQASSSSISHQDALVAHIWSRINAARGFSMDEDPVYCNYMIGFRSRTCPPLGDHFVGAPFVGAFVQCKANESCDPEKQGMLASKIASTTKEIDAAAIKALVRTWAHDSSPTRVWGTMYGPRYLLVTSWVRIGVNEVDFGFGRSRFARPHMPSIDGLILPVEASGTLSNENSDGGPWYRNGADVSVWIADEAMQKLLTDPLLLPS